MKNKNYKPYIRETLTKNGIVITDGPNHDHVQTLPNDHKVTLLLREALELWIMGDKKALLDLYSNKERRSDFTIEENFAFKCVKFGIPSTCLSEIVDNIDIANAEFIEDIVVMPYTEMSTVARSIDDNFIIVVTPDTGRNDAYLEICNHSSYNQSTHVIRLSFKEPKYFTHKGDGKQLWKLRGKDMKNVIKFLQSTPKLKERRGSFQTNWDLAIFLWNLECGFTDHPDYDESYPEGCIPGSILLKKPQYVKMNQQMPDYTQIQF
jgi:hypothetical protein